MLALEHICQCVRRLEDPSQLVAVEVRFHTADVQAFQSARVERQSRRTSKGRPVRVAIVHCKGMLHVLQRWTGSADLVAAQPAELRMLAEQFIRFGVAVAESAQQVFGLTTKAIDMGIVR